MNRKEMEIITENFHKILCPFGFTAKIVKNPSVDRACAKTSPGERFLTFLWISKNYKEGIAIYKKIEK